jgi:hypothetical protein
MTNRIEEYWLSSYFWDSLLDTVIDRYIVPISQYAGWYNLNLSTSGYGRKLMFDHPYGPKWTGFLKNYANRIVKTTTGREPEIQVIDNIMTISI